jgi:hypothetical protein
LELSSEPTVCISVELVTCESTVEAEESSVDCDAWRAGTGAGFCVEVGSGSCWRFCWFEVWSARAGCGSLMDRLDGVAIGSSIGSSCCVSLMEMTIFSRSTGVMCFSRPRLVLLAESCLLNSGRACGMRVAGADDVSSSPSSSSEMALSMLLDSTGTGMLFAAACDLAESERRGERVDRACWSGEQQNVSRFHNLQLKFSSLFPSSIACDVFEKSDHCWEAVSM